MNKINTVLFDFDGTVMDTNQLILKSWQHTFLTLEGAERPDDEIMLTFGEPISISMARALPQYEMEESVGIYRSWHHAHYEDLIKLFPGIFELLAKLKALGYKTGLVTNRLKDSTINGLQKFDIEKFFDAIVTADDVVNCKPDPEPALTAMKRLGSAPSETVFVGDSKHDMKCARNAGLAAAVLVDWAVAISEEDKTGPFAPDYILKEAGDLLEWLRA